MQEGFTNPCCAPIKPSLGCTFHVRELVHVTVSSPSSVVRDCLESLHKNTRTSRVNVQAVNCSLQLFDIHCLSCIISTKPHCRTSRCSWSGDFGLAPISSTLFTNPCTSLVFPGKGSCLLQRRSIHHTHAVLARSHLQPSQFHCFECIASLESIPTPVWYAACPAAQFHFISPGFGWSRLHIVWKQPQPNHAL